MLKKCIFAFSMRRLTTEEFKEKARTVHGDRYDLSRVDYKNAQEKVCIVCHERDMFGDEHGEFWVKPYNFLNGGNCPKCAHTQWTTEKFIKAARMVHGDKYDYSKAEFKSVRDKVCIICHENDRKGNEIGEFWQLPLEHLEGHGCRRERRGSDEEAWEVRTCPICGKKFKIRKKYEKITCSPECRREYVELHKDEIKAKQSEALRKAFAKKTKEEKDLMIERARATSIARYGKPNFAQTEEGRRMSSEVMKKYKRLWDKENVEKKLIPKYKQICDKDNLDLLEFRSRFDCTVRCRKCGNVFITKTLGYLTKDTTTHRCRVCYPIEPITGPTKIENEMASFLDSLGVSYYKNCRNVIHPLELDFYLPEYRTAIEMDGLFWHSEISKPNPEYHLKKTEMCISQGVRLVHIFEDEWYEKQDICKSIIMNILKEDILRIGARQCEIVEVETAVYRDFINKNHIQGYAPAKFCYGLQYRGELLMMMAFGKPRRSMGYKEVMEGTYEIIRLCTKMGCSVSGGASRLLKAFIVKHSPRKIITYADRRWSEGNVYEKIGFTFERNTKPNYFYVVGATRKNRFAFRKSELVKKYGCSETMTEREFCLENRLYRIYDCGSKLFELDLEKQ